MFSYYMCHPLSRLYSYLHRPCGWCANKRDNCRLKRVSCVCRVDTLDVFAHAGGVNRTLQYIDLSCLSSAELVLLKSYIHLIED